MFAKTFCNPFTIKFSFCFFILVFWPSLLNVEGFLQQFITPIVKVSKGVKSRQFFSLPEYEEWLGTTGNNGKGYKIKYYKGLGTSTSAEAKDYFSHLEKHQLTFSKLQDDEILVEEGVDLVVPDGVESGSDLVDMVFSKLRVPERKVWLSRVPRDVYMDYDDAAKNGVKYSDFFNKEFIHFSNYDNERSIPSMIDGFKPSQRKVIFGCFKRKLTKNEIKVAQLTGYIAEHSAYHHGETSLAGAIIGMAQTFVVRHPFKFLVFNHHSIALISHFLPCYRSFNLKGL
jgi:DNA topoisomerase II